MKPYPSIPKIVRHDIPIMAFNKIDGSLIRAEWNPKRGFYKFGTKTQLIDDKSLPFGKAIPLLQNKYEKDLVDICKKQNWESAVCFFEFYGASSFAGAHNFDEAMDVILFDINPFKRGLLPPEEFLKLFGHLDVPQVLYQGFADEWLFDFVKQSILPGMSKEGVVCKGIDKDKLVMFKIKSKLWLNDLKRYCGDNHALFERLS